MNSDPGTNRFVFGYHITITNKGSQTVQLLARHWVILDADGERRDVRGSGVVGRRPVLEPGNSFEYNSGCPLGTPWGTMEGSYTFHTISSDGMDALEESLDEDEGLQPDPPQDDLGGSGRFEVPIARFYLVAPAIKNPG